MAGERVGVVAAAVALVSAAVELVYYAYRVATPFPPAWIRIGALVGDVAAPPTSPT